MQEKKLVQINTVCNNSTGHIMREIQKKAEMKGYRTCAYVGRGRVYSDMRCVNFGNVMSFLIHVALNFLFDCQGKGSYFQTKKLIRMIKSENPDIIHLHNLHGYYIHIPTLMNFLQNDYLGEVVWTFHDLWPITGHCPYYVIANCDKWKTQCKQCPNKGNYPISIALDASKKNYQYKKKLFNLLTNLNIVVPSIWMQKQVQQSFLKGKNVHVIPNGINLEVYKYCFVPNVYNKYQIPAHKKVILGVASIWEKRKGLDVFLNLAKEIRSGNLEEYIIVLVGVSKKQINRLPAGVIGIQRTERVEELVALYSRADIFVNPSKEESFSLVTIEAMACGTPVIALDTSAVKELVSKETGIILHEPSIVDYVEMIKSIVHDRYDRNIIRTHVEQYSVDMMTEQILALYDKILCCNNKSG